MLIWILAGILFAIAGACGYKLGGVRMAVSWVGLVLAAALALPLSPVLARLVPLLGIKNPIWAVIVPPLIAFFLVYFIFIGLSFFVHRKVELHIKYSGDDVQRLRWERVNHATGALVGLMTGTVWLFLIGLVIYVAGYFTVQVTSDQTNTTWVKLLSQSRQDLESTGFEKAVAPFDPMPPRYYEASDILGLIYQNPILVGRIAQYPPFLLLGERPEFQELAKDTEFSGMLLSKGDVAEMMKHPKIQGIIQNPEIVQELLAQDLKDFRAYLETGISPKYQDEKILGKWKLDPYATMAQERRKHPDLSSTEMRQLKKVMTEVMPAVSFIATTDKKASLKADISEKLRQLLQPPTPPAPVAQATPNPSVNSRYANRYGTPSAAAPVAAPPPAPKTNEVKYMVYSAQGAWERDGEKYRLSVQDEKGKSQTVEATADEERLTVFTPNATLVFAKAD